MIARRFALVGNLLFGAVLLLVVWALLVYVASRPACKTLIDLTPQQVNSVDPVTEELLRDLRDKQAVIEFHLFAPPQDPGGAADPAMTQSLAIRRRLVDLTRLLLVRYAYLGGESVQRFDHEFSGAGAQATRDAMGRFDYKFEDAEVLVVAVRMPGKESRHRKLSLVSDLALIDLPNTGVAMPGGTQRMPVPVLKDYRGEQGISSALKSLLVQGIPVAYVLKEYSPTADFDTPADAGYNAFVAALVKSGFEAKFLSLRDGGGVPVDAALVMVLEPSQEFTDRDAQTLFQYVQRGGRLLVNYAWSGVDGWNPTGGKLGELLGYELSEQAVFHLIPDQSRRSQGGGFDGDLGVTKLHLLCNKGHPTTRRLAESGRAMEMQYARWVRERAGAPPDQKREPLLSTHEYGWLAVPGADGFPDYRAPKIQLRPFEVALAIEVPNAGGDAKARPGQAVILGGMVANNAGMKARFGDFAVNVCNWMTERRELLDLPGDAYQTRQLDVQLPQFLRTSNFLIYGVPGTFLALGFVVVMLRRRQ